MKRSVLLFMCVCVCERERDTVCVFVCVFFWGGEGGRRVHAAVRACVHCYC